MNQVARTFILVGLVVVILFAMRFLPTIYLGDNELRQVNILSDLLPETLSGTDSTEVLDIPEPPSVVASVPDTVVVYDSIDGVDTVIPRMIQPQTTPEGVTMIADYGQGQSGGMHHFYQQLARVKELNRPVRTVRCASLISAILSLRAISCRATSVNSYRRSLVATVWGGSIVPVRSMASVRPSVIPLRDCVSTRW